MRAENRTGWLRLMLLLLLRRLHIHECAAIAEIINWSQTEEAEEQATQQKMKQNTDETTNRREKKHLKMKRTRRTQNKIYVYDTGKKRSSQTGEVAAENSNSTKKLRKIDRTQHATNHLRVFCSVRLRFLLLSNAPSAINDEKRDACWALFTRAKCKFSTCDRFYLDAQQAQCSQSGGAATLIGLKMYLHRMWIKLLAHVRRRRTLIAGGNGIHTTQFTLFLAQRSTDRSARGNINTRAQSKS